MLSLLGVMQIFRKVENVIPKCEAGAEGFAMNGPFIRICSMQHLIIKGRKHKPKGASFSGLGNIRTKYQFDDDCRRYRRPWHHTARAKEGDPVLMKQDAKTDPSRAEQPWGLLSCIDLYECDPETIRDAEKITLFVSELCKLIEMKRFGETQVVHFGEDERVAGFSMIQLIETSLISAHFANASNATYLDVFSCKLYDPQIVADFAKKFFKAKEANLQTVNRQ